MPGGKKAKFFQLFLVLDWTKHTRLWLKKGYFFALCHAPLQATMKCLDCCMTVILPVGNCCPRFWRMQYGSSADQKLAIAAKGLMHGKKRRKSYRQLPQVDHVHPNAQCLGNKKMLLAQTFLACNPNKCY